MCELKELATYTPMLPSLWWMLEDGELKEKLKAEALVDALAEYKEEHGVEGIATVTEFGWKIEPRCEHNA